MGQNGFGSGNGLNPFGGATAPGAGGGNSIPSSAAVLGCLQAITLDKSFTAEESISAESIIDAINAIVQGNPETL